MEEKFTRNLIIGSISALIIFAILGALVWRVYAGDRSLIRSAAFGAEMISPNADGDTDITPISYELSRNAWVSIYFENEAGDRFYFREDKLRGADEYSVLFSGVVDGFALPGDQIEGDILKRVLPDGMYTWTIEATDLSNEMETASGTLEIVDSDSTLPEMRDFGADKSIFTPNRDGINDRILIQYNLQKEANVRVFLELPGGGELPISETERDIPSGEPGWHRYDYEGGVDNGETPPEDGRYTVTALAEDAVGQKIEVSETFQIDLGGVPRAEIYSPPVGDTFEVNATAITLCDTILFTVTVENYGNTPIRTTGPIPGTIYDSDENYNGKGWSTESGAWRVAVGFENELSNYPYRWAIGDDEALTIIDGFPYLLPGERALVTGGIRVVGPFGDRNPQPMWAGLIHEDVEISTVNNRVDPKAILVDIADPENIPNCE